MNAVLNNVSLVDPGDSYFFAPAPYAPVQDLIAECDQVVRSIREVAELFDEANADAAPFRYALHFFIEGNKEKTAGLPSHSIKTIFSRKGAIAAAYSAYWARALKLTDVYECMPQARRDEWDKAIRENNAPEFSHANVLATLETLLLAREKFLAERVDGIFRALSGNHVTNQPTGFRQRMILEHVFSSWGTVETSKAGYVNDLRCIIAKFMGRDEPRWSTTNDDLRTLRDCLTGVWHDVDGGMLRIRVYKKGTAHLEVHPEMAWRLNAVLHTLYPFAIAAEHRTAKESKRKARYAVMHRPLPFAVLQIIRDLRSNLRTEHDDFRGGYMLQFGYGADVDKRIRDEAIRVLEAVGGVYDHVERAIRFDYDARPVVREILLTGCIPDQKTHQYYPTPELIAYQAVAAADLYFGARVLEPSAGLGALASRFPCDPNDITLVELSRLHCIALRQKNLGEVIEGDFLTWAKERAPSGLQFDRIVMNPPFADGRAEDHVRAAAGLLAQGGKLVAIVPASFYGKFSLPGFVADYGDEIRNGFSGTSISVRILTLRSFTA